MGSAVGERDDSCVTCGVGDVVESVIGFTDVGLVVTSCVGFANFGVNVGG